MFEAMGILVQAEMKIERENISGHTDAWIKIRTFTNPEGEDILVELKSAAARSFEWMKENNTPKKEHKAQLMFYMYLTGIKKGIIFVENKDNQELWEYELEYDENYANEFLNQSGNLSGTEISSLALTGLQMKNLLNIDSDGNGIIDLEEGLYVRVNFTQGWGEPNDSIFLISSAVNQFFDLSKIRGLSTNHGFTFNQTVAFDGSYNVNILTQPANEFCTVNNGQGGNVNTNIVKNHMQNIIFFRLLNFQKLNIIL
jgi:hypothetical protein